MRPNTKTQTEHNKTRWRFGALVMLVMLLMLLIFSGVSRIEAASIEKQPTSQSIIQGQLGTLEVSASGTGTLAYQWQKDGIDMVGASAPTLNLGAVKPWNIGTYRVRVTDQNNSVLSLPATISLNSTLPSDLWNGLLLFLPFAGNNLDLSASARTITQNAVGLANGPQGGVAGAASFNGTSRLDFVPNLPDLSSMTISFWMKTADAVGHSSLFTDWDDAASNDVGVALDNETFSIFANKNGASLSWTSGNVIQPNVWNHIIWVMAPTVSKVYLNGQLVATINEPSNNSGYKLRSNIGYFDYSGGKDFFYGSLSAFRIYGRALSNTEALALFSQDAQSQAAPVVSNVVGVQRAGTKLVDITYDLVNTDSSGLNVTLQISSDAGATWTVPTTSATGQVGTGISPGSGHAIVWNAGTDWNNQLSTTMRYRITADDAGTPPGMALIPAGSFTMGRKSGDTDADAPPVSVYVSAFYMAKYEVTNALWDEVRTWGLANGYTDLPTGGGKAADHPVQTISWYAAVKWCNARSEKEGLTPCYTVSGVIHKTGDGDAVTCNWNASGYRLPTEAEMEKAARGGVSGKRFLWGETITHSQANYNSEVDPEIRASGGAF
jgi:hypothetical protein